jgi:hypothetical protein
LQELTRPRSFLSFALFDFGLLCICVFLQTRICSAADGMLELGRQLLSLNLGVYRVIYLALVNFYTALLPSLYKIKFAATSYSELRTGIAES